MFSQRSGQIERPPIATINARATILRNQGRELLNLGQAVLGLPPPQAALEAVRRYMDETTVHAYTPDPGADVVRQAVAEFATRYKGVNCQPESVMMTCGANQAYANAIFTLTDPGDEVILLGPYYFDHAFAVQLASARPVKVDLPIRGPHVPLDVEAIEAALTPATRVVSLVAPANPSGTTYTRESLRRLVELCHRRRLWLISDETYDLLTFDGEPHVSPASLPGAERVIITGSFSKTFALAAWRLGYLLGPPDFIEEAIKVQDAFVVCAPVPSQMAGLAALGAVDDFVPEAVAELTRRRGALLAGLDAVSYLDAVVPGGATFVMARLPEGQSDMDAALAILDRAGVITVPGSAFGEAGHGWVRLSFGNLSSEAIDGACRKLASLTL